MSEMAERQSAESVISSYLAAYRKSNGRDDLLVEYDRGWYRVKKKGAPSSHPYRREKIVAMTKVLRRRK